MEMGKFVLSYPLLGILFLVAWCLSPPVAYSVLFRVGAIVIVGLFTATQFNRLQRPPYGRSFFFVSAFIVGSMALGYIVGDGVMGRLGVYIFLSFLVCYAYLKDQSEKTRFKSVVYAALLLCVVWNLTTIRGLGQYSNVMRTLAKNSEESIAYMEQGVGGYGYAYTVVLLLPVGVDIFFDKFNSQKIRLVAALFLLTTYVMIFKSGYFLALLLSVVCIPLYYLNYIQNSRTRLAFVFFLLFATFTAAVYFDAFLPQLIDSVDIKPVQNKLRSVYELLHEETSVEDSEFETRYSRYGKALEYAITHPIFGGLTYKVTGNHSHFIDFAAQYGFFVLWGYWAVIYRPYKQYFYEGDSVAKTCFIMAMILLSLNVLVFSLGIVLFIITPLYCDLKRERLSYYGY